MFDSEGSDAQASTPAFFTIAKKAKSEILSWLKTTKENLLNENQERTNMQRKFLRGYMGLDSTDLASRRYIGDYGSRKKRIKKFRIPHIHDIIETKVSQMTRLKPEVTVLPANDEFSDRGAAKIAKAMVDYIFSQQMLDHKMIQIHRLTSIMGECFLFVDYNKNIGDFTPEYAEARQSRSDFKGPRRVGDVEYSLEYPWRVLLQLTDKFEDVEYYFRYKLVPTDNLIKEYPKFKQNNEGRENQHGGVTIFDTSTLESRIIENYTVVWEFYHKRTEHLPEGYHCKFTDNEVLECGDYPFSMDSFNFARLTDIDLPGDNRGVSRLEYAMPMQRLYDELTTLIGKNIYMTAHAKIVVPEKSVRIGELANENTIIQYKGPVGPSLLQVSPNPAEVYNFREGVKQEMMTLMGSHGISRGEIPKGITAASALTFLNELESERQSSDISKHANFIKEVARLSMAIAGDKYSPDDPRTVRIVGKNNVPLLKHFDAAVFSRPYDIKFESSSGFPETKAAQMQRSMEVLQYSPNLFTPERWQYILNIGGHDKLISTSTAAISSAESEVEDILNGEQVASPEFYDDHAQKLGVFYSALQNRSFKEESSNEIYMYMLKHVEIQERLAIIAARTNPLLSSQLANLRLFPVTEALREQAGEVVRSMGQAKVEAEGQANRGDVITSKIPGEDPETQKPKPKAKKGA